MSLAKTSDAAKVEVKEIKDLVTVKPLKLKPVNSLQSFQAVPTPSTSRAAIAEVRGYAPPPAPDFKYDPFDLAPRASRFSPPPPPAYRSKRWSVPGGHASAQPCLKIQPYQARR